MRKKKHRQIITTVSTNNPRFAKPTALSAVATHTTVVVVVMGVIVAAE